MGIRRNLIRDPAASALLDWTTDASGGSPTIVATAGVGPVAGVATFARVTSSASVTYLGARIRGLGVQLVVPGVAYALSAYLTPVTAAPVSSLLIIRWLDAAGSQITTALNTPVTLTQGVATRASVIGVAPIGAARAEVLLRVNGSLVSGDRVDISAVLLEAGAALDTFFMGGVGGAVWDGTVGGSTSSLYIPVVTLTATLTPDPCPRVEVLITDLPPTADTVTVYRLAAGREYQMRGGVAAEVVGALTRIDFEVPFGVPAQYRAEMFDSDGLSLGFTPTATIQVDVAETWVHNPLDPQGATTVNFLNTAAKSLKRPFDGDRVRPLGRSVAVVVTGQRRGLEDVVLDVYVDGLDQADKLQAMFGSYGVRTVPVICFRIGAADRIRLPRPLFAGILTLDEQGLNYSVDSDLIVFGMTGDEVTPPTPALVVPLLTRADLNAFYPTRAALNAAYLTRLEVNRAYDLAGTA